MIRVILADDHAVMRDGLRHILETAGGFEIVGEASDGSACWDRGPLRPSPRRVTKPEPCSQS